MEIEPNELLLRANFGKQVQAFWDSDVGTYLRNRAMECYSAAIAELKVTDPTDVKSIVKAQADVYKSEAFIDWLSEGILDGLKAADLFEEDQ